MTVVVCKFCYDKMQSTSPKAAHLWAELCNHFIKFNGNFRLDESRVTNLLPKFKTLEEMDYITTSEDEKSTIIRVNGYDFIETEEMDLLDSFCMDREEHSKNWDIKHNGQHEADH